MVFHVIVNGINSLISLSTVTLLVYRKATDLCALRYHLTPVKWQKLARQETTNVGVDVEKGDPFYTFGGNASCYSHSGKQCGGPLKVKN